MLAFTTATLECVQGGCVCARLFCMFRNHFHFSSKWKVVREHDNKHVCSFIPFLCTLHELFGKWARVQDHEDILPKRHINACAHFTRTQPSLWETKYGLFAKTPLRCVQLSVTFIFVAVFTVPGKILNHSWNANVVFSHCKTLCYVSCVRVKVSLRELAIHYICYLNVGMRRTLRNRGATWKVWQ